MGLIPDGVLGFLIGLILLVALWHWGCSAYNRNEYQEYLLGGKGGSCVGLTTVSPLYADSLEILVPSTSWSHKGMFRPVIG